MSTQTTPSPAIPHISQDMVEWLYKAFPNTLPYSKFSDPHEAARELAFRQGQQSVLTLLKAERDRQQREGQEKVLNNNVLRQAQG